MTISSHGQNSFPAIHVSQEIALFLFEIFFERNYQSNLLFHKGQLIQDYIAGKACNNVVLAIFAFASLFLQPVPGGLYQGVMDITEVSMIDWQVVGMLWGEQASQMALMTADKPSRDLVQTCQVLALFWFAKGESSRTNMHTGNCHSAMGVVQLANLLYGHRSSGFTPITF
jgi:hypothetical protein